MVYGSTGGVTSITFNLEGNVLAMGNANGTITLRDIKKQNLLDAPHFSHSEKVLILTYSPDGNHIASGSADGSAVIYNIKRQNFHTIVTGDSNIWRVAFSPDGDKLALTRSNGWVSIWDVRSWDDSRITSLTNFTIHTGPVNGVAWSPYGTRLVSGGSDRVLRIWEAETGEFVHLLNGHTGSINCVDWSPDGKIIASGSDDMSVILWDAAYGREITRLTGHTGYINDVRFSPDGKLLASSSRDGSIILWDVNLMKPLDQLKGPIPVVESIAFSPDGSLLAANSGDSVNLWKISTQEPLGQFVFGQGKKTSVVVKNDGQVLALGVQNSVPMVWNMTTNHLDQIFAKDKYTSFVLNPYDDGKTLVTGDEGGKIIIWDVSSKEALNTIETETRTAIDAAVLNPAGDVLAWSYCQTYTGGRCTESAIQLWDIKAGQASGAPLIIEDTGLVTSLVFHPKGKFLASGSANGNIFIWDLLTGQQVGLPLTEHSRPVISLTFSPDGAFLASSSPDGMTILWDMNTRQATGDPFSMPGVSSAGFSQAGNLVLATGATDGSVILWDVSADSWLQRACEAAQRNFTQREWSQFFPDRPYQKTCEQWPDGE